VLHRPTYFSLRALLRSKALSKSRPKVLRINLKQLSVFLQREFPNERDEQYTGQTHLFLSVFLQREVPDGCDESKNTPLKADQNTLL